jgi:putative flippase GtrA
MASGERWIAAAPSHRVTCNTQVANFDSPYLVGCRVFFSIVTKLSRTKRRVVVIVLPMRRILDQIVPVWQCRALVIKLLSFASIGVMNTVIDVLIFTAAYQLLELPLIASNVSSWFVAVSFSFTMNTKLTFGRETGGIFRIKDFVRFAGSGILAMIVATTTLVIVSHYSNVFAAKFLSILGSFAVNFSISHFVIFRPVPPTRANEA